MTSIDYNLLSGQSGGDPEDGIHTARLLRAALVETSRGTSLVTEWQTADAYWTTWFGFEANRISFTQEFLDAVGIDRSKMTDDGAFEMALSQVEGNTYEVRTQTGASWVNTYVQEPVTPDVPIDTGGLPEVEPVTAGGGRSNDPADDNIPF
jgi:hypothetical protein